MQFPHRFHLFQCGESDYFAFSRLKYVKRKLPKHPRLGEWRYRTSFGLGELGPYIFEMVNLLVAKDYVVIRAGMTDGVSTVINHVAATSSTTDAAGALLD